MGKRGGAAGRAGRTSKIKGRTPSSTRWLRRQARDPFVAEARRQGYRSRAAFKLIALDDRFRLLKPGARVVDLGAAPGSWSQVVAERVGARGQVIAVDRSEMVPLPGAEIACLDVLDPATPALVRQRLGGPADTVLSDMADRATGHRPTDHLRVVVLAEAAFELACEVLAPGGTLVVKVLQGGAERTLLESLKRRFRTVRHAKPPASRRDSAETYVVALGFRAVQDR